MSIEVVILVLFFLFIFIFYIRCILFMDCIVDLIKWCRYLSSYVGGMDGEIGVMLCILFVIFLIWFC